MILEYPKKLTSPSYFSASLFSLIIGILYLRSIVNWNEFVKLDYRLRIMKKGTQKLFLPNDVLNAIRMTIRFDSHRQQMNHLWTWSYANLQHVSRLDYYHYEL